jgi:hypothetical protein
MNWYLLSTSLSGMGPVTRGICVLKEMGGGILTCAKAYAWAAGQQGIRVRGVGTWPDLFPNDTVIIDGYTNVSLEVFAGSRARKVLVAPHFSRPWYTHVVDSYFVASSDPVPESAISVGEIVTAPNKSRAERWWGNMKPRVLVSQAGMNRNEAIVLMLLAKKSGYEFKVCSPWWPETRYWPSSDLIATADVVISGGGFQTWAECQRFGIPQVVVPFTRSGGLQDRTGYSSVSDALKAEQGKTRSSGIVISGAKVIADYLRVR